MLITTTLSGLFIKQKPWTDAHELWFKERAKELGDTSILEWIGRTDYFKGVDEVMEQLFPTLYANLDHGKHIAGVFQAHKLEDIDKFINKLT